MITAETRSVPTELSEGEQTTMFQAAFDGKKYHKI